MKKLLIILAATLALSASAQTMKDQYRKLVAAGQMDAAVTEGINVKDRYKAAGLYREMLDMLNMMDADITNASCPDEATLHYRVQKERLATYMGWRRERESHEQFQRLERVAEGLQGDSIVQDWLMTKDDFYKQYGTTDQRTQCYKELLERRRQGKSLAETGAQFEYVISLADSRHYTTARTQLGMMYKAWQDSVAVQLVQDSLADVRSQYADSQATLAKRDSTITTNRAIIGTLSVVALGLAAALVLVTLLWLRYRLKSSRLKKELTHEQASNEQKAHFISEISQRFAPQLQAIERTANAQCQEAVGDLRNLLSDVEAYAALEANPHQTYERETIDVRAVCDQTISQAQEAIATTLPLKADGPSIRFQIAGEPLRQVLAQLMTSALQLPETQKVNIEFKKRGPHSGTFVITNYGGQLDDESRQSLFVAFQGSPIPGDPTGLTYPICYLLASRIGGTLEVDPEFHKGVRFLLKVEE